MFESIKRVFGLKGVENNEVDKKVLSEPRVEHICRYENGKYMPEEKIGESKAKETAKTPIVQEPAPVAPAPGFMTRVNNHPHHGGLHHFGPAPHAHRQRGVMGHYHAGHGLGNHTTVTDRLRQGRDKARALESKRVQESVSKG